MASVTYCGKRHSDPARAQVVQGLAHAATPRDMAGGATIIKDFAGGIAACCAGFGLRRPYNESYSLLMSILQHA